MINTYTYVYTDHCKLHEFVLAFFARIEFETADFSKNFYEKEFYDELVSHHKTILDKKFRAVYEVIRLWDQVKRSAFCKALKDSNDIKQICDGKIIPWDDSDIPLELRQIIKELFIDLYEKIIKKSKDYFIPKYGSLLQHFHNFKKNVRNDYEFCPACGLVEMKTFTDTKRDQYDHYLSKDIYPFSAVNFKNLVPICIDCNSFEVKSNKDILVYTGVVFYPFDESHKGIDIEIKISINNIELSNIKWGIFYSNKDGKKKQIKAWKEIYNITDRHHSHISGNIDKWYGAFWAYMNDKNIVNDIPNEAARRKSYIISKRNRKVLEYGTLNALLDSNKEAMKQAGNYSRFL